MLIFDIGFYLLHHFFKIKSRLLALMDLHRDQSLSNGSRPGIEHMDLLLSRRMFLSPQFSSKLRAVIGPAQLR